MKDYRNIKKIIHGIATMDGAGVKLVREIGHGDVKDFDPFLMLDAFDSFNSDDYIKGFPWHPHRGIETVTYLIEGHIEHADNLGNKGQILAGDCQWMTAGSGIIHQEMPKPSKRMLGTQLWVNLPAAHKMTRPSYLAITKDQIPVVDEQGVRIHILNGKYKEHFGATQGKYVKVNFFDVEMAPNADWILDTEPTETLFLYILLGEAEFGYENLQRIAEKNVILFDEGKKLKVKTQQQEVRFLLLSAQPLNEPIAWGGPIVMNTQEELNLAFKELDNRTFIKP